MAFTYDYNNWLPAEAKDKQHFQEITFLVT